MTEFFDWEGKFWRKRLPGNLDCTLVENIRNQLWPWARTCQFYRRSEILENPVPAVQFRLPVAMTEKDIVVEPVLFKRAPKTIETRGKKKAAKNDDHQVKVVTKTKNRQVLEIGPETLVVSTKRTKCRKVNIVADNFPKFSSSKLIEPRESLKRAEKSKLGRKAVKKDELSKEKELFIPSFTVKGGRHVCNDPACGRNYANLRTFGNHIRKWH